MARDQLNTVPSRIGSRFRPAACTGLALSTAGSSGLSPRAPAFRSPSLPRMRVCRWRWPLRDPSSWFVLRRPLSHPRRGLGARRLRLLIPVGHGHGCFSGVAGGVAEMVDKRPQRLPLLVTAPGRCLHRLRGWGVFPAAAALPCGRAGWRAEPGGAQLGSPGGGRAEGTGHKVSSSPSSRSTSGWGWGGGADPVRVWRFIPVKREGSPHVGSSPGATARRLSVACCSSGEAQPGAGRGAHRTGRCSARWAFCARSAVMQQQ